MKKVSFFPKVWGCFFSWNIPVATKKQLNSMQAIIGQSFGITSDTVPGNSNDALADVGFSVSKEYGVPLVLQWEIALAVRQRHNLILDSEKTVFKHVVDGKYLDTYEVVRQSREICKKLGIETVGILAHPDHVWRVALTAQKIGFNVVILDTKGVPYNEESNQPWTRSRKNFLPRELIVRLLYLLKGWI